MRELGQLRAGAARKRDELRPRWNPALEESRGELSARAERAERDLDAARADLAGARQEAGTADTPGAPRRRRSGQTPAAE